MKISKWDKDKIINAYLEAPQKGFNTLITLIIFPRAKPYLEDIIDSNKWS